MSGEDRTGERKGRRGIPKGRNPEGTKLILFAITREEVDSLRRWTDGLKRNQWVVADREASVRVLDRLLANRQLQSESSAL